LVSVPPLPIENRKNQTSQIEILPAGIELRSQFPRNIAFSREATHERTRARLARLVDTVLAAPVHVRDKLLAEIEDLINRYLPNAAPTARASERGSRKTRSEEPLTREGR